MRAAAAEAGVALSADLPPSLPRARGDAARLRQVLLNLLANAVKFTPRDGRVQVLVERADASVEITVADTGKGIPPDFLPHVFERFRQAEGSVSRKYGGLGLGLSIVSAIAQAHGGTTYVDRSGTGHALLGEEGAA